MRVAIIEGRFGSFRSEFLAGYDPHRKQAVD